MKIIESTKEYSLVTKEEYELWDFENQNLLSLLNKKKDEIKRLKFEDGNHIGSMVYVYYE